MSKKLLLITFFSYFLTYLTHGGQTDGELRCGNGQLKHPNINNCKTNEDCPNSFACKIRRKRTECCQHKILRNCEPLMEDDYVPKMCKTGNETSACPRGYICNVARNNRYTVCCKEVLCKDATGGVHKPNDPKWLSREDSCNRCRCMPSGSIKCTDKPECRMNIAKCIKPCQGRKGSPSSYSPCVDRKCSIRARVKPCRGNSTNQSTCLDHEIEFIRCNENKCPRPGRKLKQRSESVNLRILGGEEVKPRHNFPWVVSLYEIGCGASVLSPSHILTAGHCVKDRKEIEILTGKHDIFKIEIFEQVRLVKQSTSRQENSTRTGEVFIHENYTIWDNDIAIIKVDPPLILHRWTQPALLPKDGSDETFTLGTSGPGAHCKIAGWGWVNQTEGSDSDVLLEMDLRVQAECDLPPADLLDVTENAFCAAKDENSAVCFGDSGGPFMCSEDGDKWVQYGIISWGLSMCGRSTVYMKTTKYLDWINDKIATDGGWGKFSSWTECHPCPSGTMSRIRVCTSPEPIGNGVCPAGIGLVYKDKETDFIVDLHTVACNCQI
ncbi:unnamed protein product [Owenia fusiformis]|uniref:Uncharacterized protein n=1 Tax=Owenia fusiformis TaxID=6347 RepID=A0A8J1UCB7_OWEFU|nr:unnamed protein product [Owenia fusiformis]